MAIISSANPSYQAETVTFTANLTSSGPAPTGSIVFTSGSTTLATVPLSGGAASYTASLATVGSQSITASYPGDSNNQPSSAALTQVVAAAVNVAPGTGGSTSISVVSGQAVQAPLTITGTAGFTGTVAFSCSGLPAHAACSFNPATVNVNGTPIATVLTVSTASTTTSSLAPLWGGGAALACGLLILPFGVKRKSLGLVFGCMLSLIGLGLLGCGGGVNSAGSGGTTTATPAGSYSFNVIAAAGSSQTSMPYTLSVQ
jgi:hypothetical protein